MNAIARADVWLARANRLMADALLDSPRAELLAPATTRSAFGCAGIATAYAATGGVFMVDELGPELSAVVGWN